MQDRPKTSKLSPLENQLDYNFRNQELLTLALTHASAHSGKTTSDGKIQDNERLEFLGDRVLGLAVAELLEERFPFAREGELARWFNRLVRMETCAEIATELDLGRYLILSGGEADSGGRKKKTILADACEAVLGAVFLDGGFDQARTIIRKYWSSHLEEGGVLPIDPKSALQEWVLAQQLDLPRYKEISRSGPPHQPQFVCEVSVKGFAPARGEGGSKRAAEQEAARTILEREEVWPETGNGQ